MWILIFMMLLLPVMGVVTAIKAYNEPIPAIEETKLNLTERMLLILEETYKYFNSSNRGTSGMNCQYVTISADDVERNCAVGRLLNKEDRMFAKEHCNLAGPGSLKYAFQRFNKVCTSDKILGLPLTFLCRLQNFHDDATNWSVNGLSDKGRYAANNIRNEIFNSVYKNDEVF
jgi:hypothetical protein